MGEAETVRQAIARAQGLVPHYERGETFAVKRTVVEFWPSWLTVCTQSNFFFDFTMSTNSQ